MSKKTSTRSRLRLPLRTVLNPHFRTALAKLGGDKMPIKERYAIARTLKNIEAEAETFETLRVELVKKFGEMRSAKEKDGWEVKQDSENWDKYVEEIRKLQDVEVELFLDHSLPLTADCPLNASELVFLNDIIEEPK